MHTRISEQLSDDIRRLAEDLRVPASNLVRNVLEEVFTVVESVSDDVGDLFENVVEEADSARERVRRRADSYGRRRRGGRSRGRPSTDDIEDEMRQDEAAEADGGEAEEREQTRTERPGFPEVVGWQPLVLNRDEACAGCGLALKRGERAFLGLTEQGLSRITLCDDCVRGR